MLVTAADVADRPQAVVADLGEEPVEVPGALPQRGDEPPVPFGTRSQVLTCDFVCGEIDGWWHASSHDLVVRLPDSSASAPADHPDGARRACQRGRGARAAASGRGAAPPGAPGGSGTG